MIILFCPRSIATGGTELLHQLGYKLNLLGFDARIYYYGEDCGIQVIHPHFLKYGVPSIDAVSDSEDNVFVYPEVMVSSLEDIKTQLPLARHILWWLSVDNAGMNSELERIISDDTSLIHYVQSYYALDYVKSVLSIPDDRVGYLSDYLNYNFLNIENNGQREDIVLFNPRKGYDRTSEIIRHSDHRIKWQALAGAAPEDIPVLLRKAKVYIDFGEHPGKDRFPREAVSCGCRIITGMKGAAANDKDVPILKRLKVRDDLECETILGLIYALVENYEQTGELYTDYEKTIHEEFHIFESDTLRLFSDVTGRALEGEDLESIKLKQKIVEAVTNEDYKKAFYLITVYRIKEYDIDEDMLILEGYTRLGIGEEQVALYLMNKLLANNRSNYEAYLIKARSLIMLNESGTDEALDLALRYSKGTEDEEYIGNFVDMLRLPK